MDLATLAIEVDTRSLQNANTSLGAFITSSRGADGAANTLASSINNIDRSAIATVAAINNSEASIGSYTRAIRALTDAELRSNGSRNARAADIQAFGAELNTLRARYDPIFAASQRYEQELNELNRAHQVGAINSQTHGTALQALNGRYASLSGATSGAVAQNRRLQQSFKGVDGQLRFLPVQLSQVVQQLIAGQPAYQVAIQQGNDINQALSGRGLRGTLTSLASAFTSLVSPIGLATIAVIAGGGALAQWAFSADEVEESADDAESAIDSLTNSVSDYQSAVDRATQGNAGLVRDYGALSQEAARLFSNQEQLNRANSLAALNAAVGEATLTFRELNDEIARNAANNLSAGIFAAAFNTDIVGEFAERVGISNQQARGLIGSMQALAEASGVRDQAIAARQLESEFRAVIGGLEDSSQASRDFLSELQTIQQSAIDVGVGIDEATNATSRFSDAIFVASGNASDLQSQLSGAISSLDRLQERTANRFASAQINLEFRGDPAGLAEAQARLNIENELGDLANSPAVQQRIEIIAQEARQAALANERLRELNQAEREAARASTQRGRASVRASTQAANARQREIEGFENTLARTQSQIDTTRQLTVVQSGLNPLVDGYERSLVATRREQELLAAAQRASIDITPQLSDRIQQLSSDYADSVEAARRVREEAQEIIRSQDQLQQSVSKTGETFANNFLDGVSDGENIFESLRDTSLDALNSIRRSLIRMASENLVENAFGGIGGSGSGGLLGGIGSLFAGFFANGGDIPRGQFGIAGEAGAELLTRPTAVAGPARITPISAVNDNNTGNQQIVVNFTSETNINGGNEAELQRELDRRDNVIRSQVPSLLQDAMKRGALR